MKTQSLSATGRLMLALAFSLIVASTGAQAQNFSVVYSFTGGADGASPLNGLVAYGVGTMYGATSGGGASNNGAVFKLTSSGETTIYSFKGGNDGSGPQSALIVDMGKLYGTTTYGGATGRGTVYQITTAGQEEVIYGFAAGTDGSNPQAGLVRDSKGNLYGTTTAGGANGAGTVFKLTRPIKTGEPWTEQILYSFGAAPDGTTPVGGVAFDASGNLYGTTSAGGTYGYGAIFQLVPSGSSWTENILHEFQNGDDGAVPYAGLVYEKSTGTFFGAATEGGGSTNAGGTIFELTPSGSSWNYNVLYALPGWGISGTFANVLVASASTIYATTHCDGGDSAGTVYKLSLKNGVWTYTQLYMFTGQTDGLYSYSNLAVSGGALYGTTKLGGANGNGVIFKVAP